MKVPVHAAQLAERPMHVHATMIVIFVGAGLLSFAVSHYLKMPVASFLALAGILVVTKLSFQQWERWFSRQDGEARFAEALKSLPDDYVVIRDVVFPDSKGTIDRLLIGPKGLFTIEIENHRGYVKCHEDRWFLNRRPMRSLSKEAKRNSLAVRSSISTLFTPGTDIPTVTPLLVFPGSGTRLKLIDPTLPVLRLKELAGFLRDYQPSRPITEYEQRSIVFHLQSLQPGYEDLLDPLETLEEEKKIA
jgi:hypothetical protein